MTKLCCICYARYIGYGHNAQPVREGRCCDECNSKVVFPMRVIRAKRMEVLISETKARQEENP